MGKLRPEEGHSLPGEANGRAVMPGYVSACQLAGPQLSSLNCLVRSGEPVAEGPCEFPGGHDRVPGNGHLRACLSDCPGSIDASRRLAFCQTLELLPQCHCQGPGPAWKPLFWPAKSLLPHPKPQPSWNHCVLVLNNQITEPELGAWQRGGARQWEGTMDQRPLQQWVGESQDSPRLGPPESLTQAA